MTEDGSQKSKSSRSWTDEPGRSRALEPAASKDDDTTL